MAATDIKQVKHIEYSDLELWRLNKALENGWVILSVVVLPQKKNGTIVAHYVLGHALTKADMDVSNA